MFQTGGVSLSSLAPNYTLWLTAACVKFCIDFSEGIGLFWFWFVFRRFQKRKIIEKSEINSSHLVVSVYGWLCDTLVRCPVPNLVWCVRAWEDQQQKILAPAFQLQHFWNANLRGGGNTRSVDALSRQQHINSGKEFISQPFSAPCCV